MCTVEAELVPLTTWQGRVMNAGGCDARVAVQERNLTHPDFGPWAGHCAHVVQLARIHSTDGSAGASVCGWLAAYWDALTSPQTLAALRLTVGTAVLVTAVNVVMGRRSPGC